VNGSVFVQGDNITFSASVQDPDIVLGQVLNVNWSNNVTGPMMHRRSDMEQAFVISTLLPGNYRVEVTVSDGEFEKKAWVLLTVEAPPKPKPQEEPIFTVAETIGLILLVIVVITILATAVVYISRGKREGDAPPEVTADEAPVVAEVTQGHMEDIEWVPEDDEKG
jgi:flagellar biosynthesis/type III secretory pathway M-ring protein FliF/YscJ